jgi:NADH-quinone oxidoreductase subunit M
MTIGASELVLIPLVGAVLLALLPFSRAVAGPLALLFSLGVTGGVAGLAYRFDTGAGFQFSTDKAWIPGLGIRYHVAIDGISLALVAMTALVSTCAIGYAVWEGRSRTRLYFALLLLLEAALVTVFVSRDLILFYVGFEAMLIPFYFLIGIYGGENRRRATLKLIIYTFVGTLLMLVGILALGLRAKGGPAFGFDQVGTSNERWIFLTFALAFAIKSPLWPFHGWLPDAYRAAPPEVAALLSGVASKAGAYGFLRLALPLFPKQAAELRWWLVTLATIGLLYGSLVAFRQPDSRGVIAYSSIGQMGLIVLGIFLINARGEDGAVLQMVNHGLLSAALFLIAGWLAVTTGAERFEQLGGLARGRPILATMCVVVGVATLAVPGSSTFASEFLILLGAFERHWYLGTIAAASMVLSAMYMLRWVSAVLHDREGPAVGATRPPDLRSGALGAVLPLVVAVLALSFAPNVVTRRVDAPTKSLATGALEYLP